MAVTKLTNTKFKINIGFLSVESNWEVDDIQRNAAWEMYVELATRISTTELKEEEGLIREALTSLYSLFSTTRSILKKYGPSIATSENPNDTTFGHIAINLLNRVLRPILSKWHPALLDWEQRKPIKKSTLEHENQWDNINDVRSELNQVRLQLIEYANVLGEVSGVSILIKN